MDHRGWPWKKKSSNKTAVLKALDAADPASSSLASVASLQDQGNGKNLNYIQLPLDSYVHLAGLEDEVKKWHSQVNDLKEQLSVAKLEITAKDNLATQHSKVAEEAVSGWEKADAEASELKKQLASISLLKITAEDRTSHLDGALKECLIQLRVAKEEHREKINEVILTKNKECDRIKTDLEAKITEFEQRLLRSAAENTALSRSLQEHSSMLRKISDEKSQVEVENELLKRDIQSCEKESNSLKYEVHVVSKELEIRNEEKNMSLRSAEAANKQYLDGAKKIAKLEAECQRLRGLVKKKLPGPAAIAQMKLEVENWAYESGEPRTVPNKPLGKNSKSHSPSLPDIHSDDARLDHKETELLMKRFLGVEEETKMLKEALAMRNSELQSSRDLCAKMAGRIKNLEMQVQILNQRMPRSIFQDPTSGSSPNASDPQSVISLSEDGFDDDGKYSESPTISDLSNTEKDKIRSTSKNCVTSTSIDLMDDFLEMERIAHIKNNSENSFNTGSSCQLEIKTVKDDASAIVSTSEVPSDLKVVETSFVPKLNQLSSMLLSKIFMVLESHNKDTDLRQVLEDVVKSTMLDLRNTSVFNSSGSYTERPHCNDISLSQTCGEGSIDTKILSLECSKVGTDAQHQDLVDAVSGISKFVMCLKSVTMLRVGHGLIKEYDELSSSLDKFLSHEFSLVDLFVNLSHILAHISDLKLTFSPEDQELDSPDSYKQCTAVQCIDNPHSDSNHEVPTDVNLASSTVTSCKCAQKIEELKVEKDGMAKELARLNQDLECKMLQLEDLDSQLTEARSELVSSRKCNGLAETQLKCITESYKLLETRAQEQEANVKLLQEKLESLEAMLEEEKRGHGEALVRIKDLQDQIHRKESCQACSLAADVDVKSKKEREIADAAAKLAECQETIFLLGKQLKTLHHPQTELVESQYKETLQPNETSAEYKLARSCRSPQSKGYSHDFENNEMGRASSFDMRGVFDGSPLLSYDSSSSPSSRGLSRRANKQFSSPSSTSGLNSENKQNGFTRFFPSKGEH